MPEANYVTSGRPRAYKAALVVSVVATIVSLLLAVLPGILGPASYDPTLAVLTATLIALVWYTFFTYLAAARLEPSFVSVRLGRDGLELEPWVENPTRRSLHAKVWMRLWADGAEQAQSPFYSGSDALFLAPQAKFKGCVQARPFLDVKQNKTGEEVYGVAELLVMLRVRWTDDSGESGDTGPRFYRFTARGSDVISVVASENIQNLFPPGAGNVE